MYQEIHTPSATYTFRLYPISTVFKRIAGIYTFLIIPVAEAPNPVAEALDPVAEALEATPAETLHPVAEALEATTAETLHPVAEALEATTQKDPHPPSSIFQPYSLLYLGITNDFYARLATHHKINAALTLGMTHIGILRKSSGRRRKSIEKNLLQNLNPPLNQTWLQDNL